MPAMSTRFARDFPHLATTALPRRAWTLTRRRARTAVPVDRVRAWTIMMNEGKCECSERTLRRAERSAVPGNIFSPLHLREI